MSGLDPEQSRQLIREALAAPTSDAFVETVTRQMVNAGKIREFIQFGITRSVAGSAVGGEAISAAAFAHWISQPGNEVVVTPTEVRGLREKYDVQGNFDALAQIALDDTLSEAVYPNIEAGHRRTDDAIVLFEGSRARPTFYREQVRRERTS